MQLKFTEAVAVLGVTITAAWLAASPALAQAPAKQAAGPLRVHPDNPQYFTDGTNGSDGSLKAVYLTGSHTWNNLQDVGPTSPPIAFDFGTYVEFLTRHNHNFIRLWAQEEVRLYKEQFTVAPHPWLRTGPGVAFDGRPKFDLNQYDPEYFERLRARVDAAGQRGI